MGYIAILFVNVIFLAMLVPTTCEPKCNNVDAKILKIEEELKIIRQQSEKHCQDYGHDKSRRNPIGSAKIKHKLEVHTVCRDPDVYAKKVYVQAEMNYEDIGEGTTASEAAIRELRASYKLNSGMWSRVCYPISAHLQQTVNERHDNYELMQRKLNGEQVELITVKNRFANIEIAFYFGDTPPVLRPASYVYKISLSTDSEDHRVIYGRFENVDHTYARLDLCKGSGNKELYEVVATDPRLEALKTCRVEDQFSALFEKPFCPPKLQADQDDPDVFVDERCSVVGVFPNLLLITCMLGLLFPHSMGLVLDFMTDCFDIPIVCAEIDIELKCMPEVSHSSLMLACKKGDDMEIAKVEYENGWLME